MNSDAGWTFLRGETEASTSGRSRTRRRIGMGALLLVVLGIGLLGGHWLRQRMTHVEENDAQVAGEVTTIASRVDGWLLTRPVMEGDHVVKGQVLGELDTRDARKRLASLQGSLTALEAQIRETTIQHDTTQQTSEAHVSDVRAQLAAAQAASAVAAQQEDLARADFNRADPLVKGGNISRRNWDHSRSTLLQAEETRRQAEAEVASRKGALAQAIAQRGQVAVLEQQIQVLRGQRDATRAQADEVRQEIADRTLRAPYDGVVDRTFIHPGDYVQAGQWLMMMHDPNDVWVEANVKETALGRVRVGQEAAVTVDAYPDLVLHGRVLRVGNAATNQFALLPSPNPSGNFTKITQRVPVRIALDKPARALQPGLMAEVSIDVAH